MIFFFSRVYGRNRVVIINVFKPIALNPLLCIHETKSKYKDGELKCIEIILKTVYLFSKTFIIIVCSVCLSTIVGNKLLATNSSSDRGMLISVHPDSEC